MLYLFLTFFFELFTFSTQTLSEKLHVLCFSVSSYFQFFFHLFFMSFFCLIFLDLVRNMLPFYRVFFTSLFPLFVHHLSICSFFFCLLLFSRFLHLFSLFKLPFFCFFSISMFLYVKLFVEKIFKLLRHYFSSFHHKKTSFSLFPFLLGFFFHVWSFSVS